MSATTAHTTDHPAAADGSKRDFLKLVGTAAAAIGVGSIAWPLIDSMNPSGDVLALSSLDLDIGPVPEGQGITAQWRGKPIFVRHRTAEEIKQNQAVPLNQLIDPVADSARVKAGKEQWAIMIGICTHLGCIPLGNKSSDPRGDFGGYFCPCHGSQYDALGRVRHGPAPANLALPPYEFLSDTKIRIG